MAEVLDSVLAQDLAGLNWEVIVADGMSDDGARAILDGYHAAESRIRILDNPARAVPAGLNAAIRDARGDVVLRMDAYTSYARLRPLMPRGPPRHPSLPRRRRRLAIPRDRLLVSAPAPRCAASSSNTSSTATGRSR